MPCPALESRHATLGISAISLILLGKLLYAVKVLWQAFWASIEVD
ncbi:MULTISPECIES: hypothetical protein [Cyanophyceae]|nr:hypothetical protein [Trichocoleus sp. FACHB-69]